LWQTRAANLPRGGQFSAPYLENGVWRVLVTQRVNQGVLVGAFTLPPLQSFSPRGIVYLVDSKGIIIAHVKPKLVGTDLSTHEGIVDVARGEAGATFHHDSSGVELVVGYAPITPTGWGLVIDEPWAEIVAPMFQYSVLLPLVLLLVAIVALGAIYFGIGNVIRPLQNLSQMANRIAFGDYHAAERPVGGVREIEELRETINGMARQVREAQDAMQNYIAQITRSQEDERKRLARELHDDTIQSLIALQQRVEMTQKALSKDPKLAAARLDELKDLLMEMLASVRRFVRDLRPTYLEELGLIPALEALARESNASFKVQGEEQRLNGERELVLFRIVQEALRNVAKHAQATRVAVKLVFEGEAVTASVEDNGVGFNAPDGPAAYARAGHFGLTGMQERAQLFSGNVYVKSERGQGTKVLASIPAANGAKGEIEPAGAQGDSDSILSLQTRDK
jgi:signal transduction histidine kinase